MYILKNKEGKIISCAKHHKAIEDAKIITGQLDGIIEQCSEKIISYDNKFYPESEWKKYKNSEEYEYNKEMKNAENEILTLKEELSGGDYKIIKAFEANLKGKTPPYNMEELLAQREKMRTRINELEHLFQ